MSESKEYNREELDELLAQVVEIELSAGQSRRLSEIIESDPEARKLYLEHCRMHAMLCWELGVLGGMDVADPTEESESHHSSKLVHFSKSMVTLLAVAACLTVGAAVVWKGLIPKYQARHWQNSEELGVISQKAGGKLTVEGLDIELHKGDALRPGNYQQSTGLTEFNLADRVRVVVEAPVRFSIRNPDLIELHSGRLSVSILPEGSGFEVITPHARAVDFGTEFGVEVSADDQSEVHVFEGIVEVNSILSDEEPVRLVARQATRVDKLSNEPQGIVAAPERFIRSVDEPSRPYSEEIRLLDPVVYYRMGICDDGVTIKDKSGNDYDGYVERGVQTRCIFSTGRLGSALRLTGPTGKTFGLVPDYPKTDNNQLSFVAWVKADSRPRWASIAKNWMRNETGQFNIGLFHDQGGLEAEVLQKSGQSVRVKDPEPFPLGEWQHVAFVADGEHFTLYRNGVEIDRQSYEDIATPSYKELVIGAKFYVKDGQTVRRPTAFWDGKIDELAIFNHGLSPEQIRQLYDAAGHVETYAVE
ncbi:MAG: FecR domain-containing protein [Verrucomicrobiae bacterium]|nr:FecR domain-containing protein [Verrucomicrobiae bacterium]